MSAGTMTFDAKVKRPDGSIGTYCADVHASGYITVRGSSEGFYWHLGKRRLVAREGAQGARLLRDGVPIVGGFSSEVARPGDRIEVMKDDQWHFAGTVEEALDPVHISVLQDS